MKLSIITPVGGSAEDARKTVASVRCVARDNPDVLFEHILVLNNGASLEEAPEIEKNLRRIIHDINPEANRSLARNTGIRKTAPESDFVLFLDSGDMLLPEAIHHLGSAPGAVHSFSSLVTTPSERFVRLAKSIRLIEVNNPFYIGATWVPTALARKYSFPDGRKEDWKLWLTLHRTGVRFVTFPQINYVYNVRSRANHTIRKSRLIKDQFNFFRKFLRKNLAVSLWSLMLHYSTLCVWWLSAHQREPDPECVDKWLADIDLLNGS